MVIEKSFLAKGMVNYIIHYMWILPKWRDKGYGKYLMGKALSSDHEIQESRVYAVTRLIHNYTPSDYDEPGSEYSNDQLTAKINQDRIDDNRNVSRCIL